MPAPQLDTQSHTELFSLAVKAFTAGDYRKAKEIFERASQGPQLPVNESAKMYMRMCQQRIDRATTEPRTAEEHYNYSVSLINAKRFADARPHLESAIQADAQPHYYYALALVEGMLGSVQAAAAQLKRALEKDPSIRATARNDPDFQPLLQHTDLRELLAGAPSQAT